MGLKISQHRYLEGLAGIPRNFKRYFALHNGTLGDIKFFTDYF